MLYEKDNKPKKQNVPIHIFVYFILFYFLCYNCTYHNVSNIATIFWVTVINNGSGVSCALEATFWDASCWMS